MAVLALRIKTNFAKAEKDLRSMGAVADDEAAKLAKYNKAFTDENIKKWNQSNRRAVAAIKATKGPLEAAIANQRNLERKIQQAIRGGIEPQDRALRGLRKELVRATKRTERLSKAQGRLGRVAGSVGKGLGGLAKIGAVGVGAALGAITTVTVGAVKSFSEFGKSVANLNTLIPVSAKEYDAMTKLIRNTSEELGQPMTELMDGMYQSVSAGASSLREAFEITDTSARLAKGALVETSQAVDIITTAMNAYGSEIVSARKASDVFFQIIKSGKINGEQLSAVIGQSISLYASAGIKIEELGAGLATMTKLGVGASEATTQLNAIVNSFIKPSEEMTKALEAAGHASGQALLEAEGLSGAIEFLSKSAQGNLQVMGKLLPNQRALRGALVLSANGAKEFNSVLGNFNNVAGATDAAVKIQTEGYGKLGETLKKVRQTFKNLLIEIGEGVSDNLVGKLEGLMGLIDNNREKIIEFAKKFITIIFDLPIYAMWAWDAIQVVWQRIQNFFSNFAEIMVNSVKVVLLTIKKGSIERQIADELEKGGWASMEDVPAIRDISEVSGISGFEGIGDNPRRLLPELEELTKEIDKLKGLGNESIIGDTTITTMDEIRARFESLRKEIGLLDAESFLKLLEGDSEGDSGGKDVLDAFTPTPEQIKHWEALNKHKAQYVEPIPPSFWDSFSEGIKHVRNETDLLRLAFISAFQALKLNAEEAKAATKAVERTFQDLGKVMELSFQNRIREIDYWKYHKMNALDDQRNAEIAALTAGIHDEERKNKIVADYDKKHAAKKKYLEQKAAYDTWKIQVEQFKIKKALDLASIVMNTSVGVMQTYAQVGGVLGKVLSGAVLAAGVTAFALTAAKEPPPPPRFQTGGRFVVPGSPGAYPDNVGLRVNPGETVDITPRGVEPERNITVVVQLDSDVLFREVQRGIDGGEIIINTEEFTK